MIDKRGRKISSVEFMSQFPGNTAIWHVVTSTDILFGYLSAGTDGTAFATEIETPIHRRTCANKRGLVINLSLEGVDMAAFPVGCAKACWTSAPQDQGTESLFAFRALGNCMGLRVLKRTKAYNT